MTTKPIISPKKSRSMPHPAMAMNIAKAMAAKADFVVFFNFGKDTITALKQADNFGLKKKAKLLVPWSSGTMDLMEIGPETAFYSPLGKKHRVENIGDEPLRIVWCYCPPLPAHCS